MRICSIAEHVIAGNTKDKSTLYSVLCFIVHSCLLLMTVNVVILIHKRGRLFCEGGTYVTDFI